ncbi:hypothetical protein AU468_13620 [Alkalispirochaeta sphaeroplastigenens]|uniref:Nucleotidyltransferase n=1 Tax=Alkalispirochaeta sphaeroplastigenens TaxID=1187066 RepID=A0A2S4JFP4_9SPIO|nr:nucleotidyltransferase substrate binding protein [Alkalispirochaeta sphaeroplastigenens]POQ98388.1 hypothetical protein AU468_13620 [Alkalispirochaeta sphaeroplastigenens]
MPHHNSHQDIRWEQRHTNLLRASNNLHEALAQTAQRRPSKLERQGIVKAFELAYELAWKTLQDYLKHQGYDDVVGPKAVLRLAFSEGLIQDGERWAAMHRARNEGAHIYSDTIAETLEQEIRNSYAAPLQRLSEDLGRRRAGGAQS